MVGIGGRMRSLHAYWHKNSDLDESGVPGDFVEICCVHLFYWNVIYQKMMDVSVYWDVTNYTLKCQKP